ncbi:MULTISPECIES: non-ribosomal peptide synthetase [Okeania]|uniref:non-ribosomal peptide synthetase n=1 Tax=Okeania TaxID=1458928 RepID=UPI000F53664F|nr:MULTISPECIES: non-ribosomal peptide synthetase [Okeania]NET12391.1 amino acid adenylation domain-containing protein [Okeania sp. SIO1H6]NES79687.1 amino acid adenylation domain-containing protein [Okeania sp. SIO1H4]NET23366.1 amino acid adenylation domain-containing protein [Okeania sp. SIO1H5]NET75034.1 amino acid adenylation domain-containing protein [Okeania sp. SIO1F9]NET97065.1 amino acid adenylation domain-containing protein [Okeania sp. SIO1H2]
MNLIEFLQDLSLKGVKLWIEGERLRSGGSKEVLTADVIAQLRQHKDKILQLLRERPDIFNVYPLSFGQRALWFLWRLAPKSSAYNVAFNCRIYSQVNLDTLQKAWQLLSERHSLLRTTFLQQEQEPFQKIHSNLEIDFRQIDASNWNENELNVKVVQEYQHPFNLEDGPVARIRLFTYSHEEHILLLVLHHLNWDAWSIGIVVQEWLSIYQSLIEGTKNSLTPIDYTYLDYVHWQKELLASDKGKELWEYWQQKLSGELPVLNLPVDKPRPKIQTYNGASYYFQLPENLTKEIREVAKREGVTLYMMLLATFQVLLHRYTGQEDILVGSPTSGRTRYEFTNIVGYFVDPMVMRANLEGNPSFSEFLTQVQQTVKEAVAHQDFPFALLVERLQPDRDLSYSPIFQVSFVLQNFKQFEKLQQLFLGQEIVEVEGLKLKSWSMPQQEGQFDLELEMVESNSSLVGCFKYNADLFEEPTICRMAGHFQTLLEGIVVNPEQKVRQLPLLTTEEHHKLLVTWNNTKTDYLLDKCIHQLFEEQVERSPNSVALVFETEELTYQQLNEQANQLAHYLQAKGIGSEKLVGICVERSPLMVVGLLAILKAGGAYIPLDPNYPQERLSFILEDSQVSVLLTQKQLEKSLPQHQAQSVFLDTDWEKIGQYQQDNPNSEVTIKNLAYTIYTSGSTGQPKGAMNTHQGICNRLCWMQETYKLTTVDRVLQKTPFSFDVSVWEFFWPLITGACLVLAKPEGHKDSAYLVKLIAEKKITTIHFVPSMLQVFLEEIGLETCDSLKQVFCSGEALSLQLQEKFFNRLKAKLHNLYGPTEAAIDVTFWECTHQSQQHTVPIGRPIANTQIYLLDSHLQLVPIGVPGEIHIGGLNLARGYLNRPKLTGEKFIHNPFSEDPESRLYKTGDLARYLNDGSIEFLGRIDYQVKIRGFRIELGEIETILSKHSAIKTAVVVVREDITNDKQLVAYIVPESEQALTSQELRSFLKTKLPSQNIPSAFVFIDTLPLTPNGKLDRRALPTPNQIRPDLQNTYIAPKTSTEQKLADIWAKVLNLKKVGIHDNFFELGGDSIRSIQVRVLGQKIGLDFSIEQIFQHQTIHELAKEVSTLSPGFSEIKTEPFSLISNTERQKLPDDIEDAYPLARLQAGMIFHSEYNHGVVYHDIFSYHLRSIFKQEVFQEAIQNLVRRHPILRTSFDLAASEEPIQLVHQKVDIPLLVEDLRHLSGEEQELTLATWVETEKKQNFDLSRPPLIRFQIHLRTEETFQLSLSFHHAILDGWSVASLFSELLQKYSFLLEGKAYSMEDSLAFEFRDFVAKERRVLSNLEHQEYWLKKLEGITFTKLPRPFNPYDGADTERHRNYDVDLPYDISDGLKQIAHSLNVPLKSVLLAAHLKVLSVLSNQSDVITGLVSNSRPEADDVEKVLGLFLNTLPFSSQLQEGTWIDLIRETFENELEILPNREYPMAELQRILGGQPLFETAFNFIHFDAYKKETGLTGIELLGGNTFEANNLSLLVNFMVDPDSSLVKLFFSYNAAQLDENQISRLGDYYANTLATIVNKPNEQYLSYSPLSEAEQQLQLVEWNKTQANYPQDKCIHHLFEAQVEKTPEAVAIVFKEKQLTYHELNIRANQLANYLQSLGIGSETLVGICVERSLEMVVGILAILKAGGAYVPLDPNYPQERLSLILEDSQVSVLLTQQQLKTSWPQNKAHIVFLDTDWEIIAQHKQDCPINEAKPNHLAYVIYTSGSTGVPKGVAIEHRNTINLLYWAKEVFSPESLAGVLASTSICFDLSVFELFVALCWGGKSILAENALEITNLPVAKDITLINTVPSVIAELLKVDGIPESVKTVNLAGEPLHTSLVKELYKQDTIKSVFDLYGPSEATTYSTFALRSSEGLETIGRPIANTQIYILDSNLKLLPAGVPGELYIGGDGLARGYLNRPQLTGEKFILNPFNHESSCLYKTGDLARYLNDGNIEFLGRIDNQVKIRGFRIELGEIEAVLNTHPQIEQAVVMAREDIPDRKTLVAYVVYDQEKESEITNLRSFLKHKLPEYMIPNVFVHLDTLPLTPNGKIDRKALPIIDSSKIQRKEAYYPAITPIEEQLLAIWRDVLEIQHIGVRDNFFDLGGHSLLAVRLMAQIQAQFSKNLPLAMLVRNPTIETLAAILSRPSSSSEWDSLVKIHSHGSKTPIFCVPGAGGNVLYLQDLARLLKPDRPFYVLQAQGLDGIQTPQTRVEEMAAKYIKAIQSVQPEGPYILVGHCFGGYVTFEMALQLTKQGHKIALLAILGISGPLRDNYPLVVDEDIDDDAQMLIKIATRASQVRPNDNPLLTSYDELTQISSLDEQLDNLIANTNTFTLLDPVANRLMAKGLMEVRRGNLIALLRYNPQETYSDRITLFRGMQDIPQSARDLNAEEIKDWSYDWNNFSTEPVEVIWVPGDRTTMLSDTNLPTLSEKLQKCLDFLDKI